MINSSPEWYADLLNRSRIHETGAITRRVPEIEVQARWFSGEFGTDWVSQDGVGLRIIDFGEWNREPGPDFTGATIQLANGTILRGDVEIDTDVRDWERHGHMQNASFGRTVLHVFSHVPESRFFTKTHENRFVHQVLLPAISAIRGRSDPPPGISICSSEHDASALLFAAARYRLHRKAQALHGCASACGEDAAWYRAIAVALGYKANKLPFLLLAERCGRSLASKPTGEALLFGTAGFLSGAEPALTPEPTRAYLKSLWSDWWMLRATNERLVIDAGLWSMGGNRPANHPHRRVAALGAVAKSWKPVAAALRAGDRDKFAKVLQQLEHPFWSVHFNLHATPLKKPQSLIGTQRLQDIITNVFYPAAMMHRESIWEQFLGETGTTVSRSHEMLADRFFPGVEIDRKFLKSCVHQQGLLQLDGDFRSTPDPMLFAENLRTRMLMAPCQ